MTSVVYGDGHGCRNLLHGEVVVPAVIHLLLLLVECLVGCLLWLPMVVRNLSIIQNS